MTLFWRDGAVSYKYVFLDLVSFVERYLYLTRMTYILYYASLANTKI